MQRQAVATLRAPWVTRGACASTGRAFVVDEARRVASASGCVVDARDCRGGILSDEPGMGKTVTALALVLKTLGRMPDPPPGMRLIDDDADGDETEAFRDDSNAHAPLAPEPGPRLRCYLQPDERYRPAASSRVALASPPPPPPTRMYLSPATLVLLPSTLIDQWEAQAGERCAGVCGRGPSVLRVLRADKPRSVSIRALCCDADVVLSTIEAMSGLTPGCALRSVRFLRLVLDEGHTLGGGGGGGSGAALSLRTEAARAISAERRWVLSGTPAPGKRAAASAASSASSASASASASASRSAVISALGNLHLLLAFIKEPLLGSSRSAWAAAVARPLGGGGFASSARGGSEADAGGGSKTNANALLAEGTAAAGSGALAAAAACGHDEEEARRDARARLAFVLRRVCVRAVKADLRGLPPLTRATTLLEWDARHAAAYNHLVSFVERCILLADWGSEKCAQSLLHPSQARAAANVERNLKARGAFTLRPIVVVSQSSLYRVVINHLTRRPSLQLVCALPTTWRTTLVESEMRECLGMLSDAHHKGWKGIVPAAHTCDGWARPQPERLAAAESAWRSLRGRCEACPPASGDALYPLVTPCCHILCLPCAKAARSRCPVCSAPFLMQHRFGELVPQDMIEQQPSVQLSWSGAQADASTKVSYVLRRMAESDPPSAAAAAARASRRLSHVAAALARHEREAGGAAAVQNNAQNNFQNNAQHNAQINNNPHPPRRQLSAAAREAALHRAIDGAIAAADAEDAPPSPHAPPPVKFLFYSSIFEHLQLLAAHLAAAGVRFGCEAQPWSISLRAPIRLFASSYSHIRINIPVGWLTTTPTRTRGARTWPPSEANPPSPLS